MMDCPANTNNQLTTCGYGYDPAGNIISSGSTSYVYDAENRLIATGGDSYVYDGDGRRVEKCTEGATAGTCASNATGRLYWLHADGGTLTESDLGGNWTAVYGLMRGMITDRVDLPSNVVRYYFSDHLNSTSIVTDGSGNILSESDYFPYGGEIVITSGDSNRYKFTGKERDSESGLDNFGARYNSFSLGRFVTPDPMGGKAEDPQSLNRYAYVRNNPLKFTDPSGMNFSLPCFTEDSGCHGGQKGVWQRDQYGNKTTFDPVSIGNKDGQLKDVSVNNTGTYTASFDGKNVSLTDSAGNTQNGSWLQGTDAVSGVSGGGNLSNKFDFTFSDHGPGQALNATFTYAGTFSEARSELYKAGYSFSALDQMFNVREMFAHPNAVNYRTPGDSGTGANSGHFLVNHSILSLLPKYSVPTTGSVHTGETNPTTSPGALWQHWTKEQ